MGAQMMVHYGHSCLVPVDTTTIAMLYVFVDIQIDLVHFIDTVRRVTSNVIIILAITYLFRFNFPAKSTLALVSTIQFVAALQSARAQLESTFTIVVPRSKPLSPGEILVACCKYMQSCR